MRSSVQIPPNLPTLEPRLDLDELPELASVDQAAKVMGLTQPQVRALIRTRRLGHVMVGRRAFVPKSAIPRFIANNTVQPCHDAIPDPVSASSKSADAFTSAGPKLAAAGSAARARQIANKLKLPLPNSSEPERAPTDRVIPLKSS
jgi:excisionase family DNA binding protein